MSGTDARLSCTRAPIVSPSSASPSLGEVKYEPERVADVAAWNVWVLFLNSATRIDQPAFRGVDVGHQEFENRAVLMTFFDV